jgi:hypothetical protein
VAQNPVCCSRRLFNNHSCAALVPLNVLVACAAGAQNPACCWHLMTAQQHQYLNVLCSSTTPDVWCCCCCMLSCAARCCCCCPAGTP